MIKVLISPHDNRIIHFEDEETKVQYRTIVAGLSWPAVKPGFVVVVAKDLNKDPETGVTHLRVLGEGEDSSLKELVWKCLDFKTRYKAQNFLGDAEDKGMMELLRQSNRDSESGSLHLQNAPYVEDPKCFRYFVMAVKNHLSSERELHTLHFDETSKLPGYLNELKKEEILTATTSDYPAISALGFALAYLDKFEYLPPLPEVKIPNRALSYAVNLDYRRKK